jgi:DNA-binding SARP family transcriptional activator
MYRSEHDASSSPVIRVYVFGEFAVERLVPQKEEGEVAPQHERVSNDAWGGRGPAQALLKFLLCRHRRRAMKDELVEALWPEPEDEERDRHLKSAERACDAAASVLRNVLRIAGGESLLATISSGDGTIYKLPDQGRLWTDADAFEALVDQALRATDAQEALPVWEAAYRLAQRGEFLEDDRYRDWAVARRERLRGKIGECVYALADLYAAQQRSDLARDLLWDAVAASPTDEDALYRLLLLLEQQGRYQAARQVYRRTQEVAEQDGLPLAPRIHALAKRIREQGARLEANSSLVMSTPFPFAAAVSLRSEPFIPDLTPADEQHNALPLLSQAIAQGILTAMREIGGQEMNKLRRRLLGQAVGLTSLAITTPLHHVLKSIELSFTSEAWERIAQADVHPSALDRATLDHFEQLLGLCWVLCNDNELALAEWLLAGFLPRIMTLPLSDTRVSFLASHGLRLQSVLAHHHLRIPEKVLLCEQSLVYARSTGEANTLVIALIELAAAYNFDGLADKRLLFLQEALHLSTHASPLVQARANSNAASAFAEYGRVEEAQRLIECAFDIFPNDPTTDPAFALADSSIFTLSYHAGKVYTYAGAFRTAFEAFERYQHHAAQAIPERLRLEIVNGQSRTALREQDAEKYAHLLEDALNGALALGSQKRLAEARHIFQHEVPATWLTNGQVKAVAEKYSLVKGV